ncbi:MAG: glycosyltransferase, partial [Sulfitobacter sp.]|nr:glycosyltransferase [Sulfitobacter sp.]
MSAPLRVLYYNWVDYLDAEARGGGVTLYQRNVIEGLKPRSDVEVSFLSSGLSYDLPARRPRWEKLRHGVQDSGVSRFEVINSGVLAPGHHSFGDPVQVSHGDTRDVFFDFIEKTGPYDVIHFNNLEGLPAEVLEIKQRAPQSKVILSLHNYYPICPQVNLWFAERETCEDFEGGARCVGCLPQRIDQRLLRVVHGLSYRLRCAGMQPGTWTYDTLFRTLMGAGTRGVRWLRKLRIKQAKTPVLDTKKNAHQAKKEAGAFGSRRVAMIALINANCDHVLCVSDAVGRVAERYG